MKENTKKNEEIEDNLAEEPIIEEANQNIDSENAQETESDKKTKKKGFLKGKDAKLTEEIEVLNQKNGELKDKYLRLVAEYDNFRKRTAKEKLELNENIKSMMLLDFLSIVDDIDRAVLHIDSVKDIEAVKEGIRLIHHKFNDFLKAKGLEEVEAIGVDFDTDLHEAVTKFPVEDENMKGKVIDVVQKGYKMNDKIVRFSKVVVGE